LSIIAWHAEMLEPDLNRLSAGDHGCTVKDDDDDSGSWTN
jgi:hypothetical protein